MKTNCPEGKNYNEPEKQRTRAELDEDWETSVKMSLIIRDLMVGNPRLAEKGLGEQAHGHQAIAAGFQGQRQWTDHFPNGDFPEAILNSSFDWNGRRAPYILATENDAMNGAGMLFGYLLTKHGADFRRPSHLLEPGGGETRDGLHARGSGGRRSPAPHQLRPRRPRWLRAPKRRPGAPKHEALLGNLR